MLLRETRLSLLCYTDIHPAPSRHHSPLRLPMSSSILIHKSNRYLSILILLYLNLSEVPLLIIPFFREYYFLGSYTLPSCFSHPSSSLPHPHNCALNAGVPQKPSLGPFTPFSLEDLIYSYTIDRQTTPKPLASAQTLF